MRMSSPAVPNAAEPPSTEWNPPASTARSLGPDDLIWEHFSRPRGADVFERIDAAAATGYNAIGLFIGAWQELRTQPDQVERLHRRLDETGLCIANIEALKGWASDGGRSDVLSSTLEPLIWEMADEFGCRYLQAIGSHGVTVPQAAEGFGALCDRAGEHGLKVGLEWLPFTDIRTAAEAMEIVGAADRINGGFCVDSWHWTRSTNNLDDIAQLPGDKVFAVQISDGPVQSIMPDDYYTDCLTNRVTPGAGEFDLVGLMQTLDRIGSQAPIGLEVCSKALWAQPVEVAAKLAIDGMRGVLVLARPSPLAGAAAAELLDLEAAIVDPEGEGTGV
jgi:sugar phosphate isomerase/epimerase